jgi:hypothetical protein
MQLLLAVMSSKREQSEGRGGLQIKGGEIKPCISGSCV